MIPTQFTKRTHLRGRDKKMHEKEAHPEDLLKEISNARSCKYNKSTSVRKDKALLLGKAFCYLLSKEPYLFTI
jgi:hypothetical protein